MTDNNSDNLSPDPIKEQTQLTGLEKEREDLIQLYKTKYEYFVQAIDESIKCSSLSSEQQEISYKAEIR